MCILFIAVDQHPQYPLIIAANRDEYHARPSAPMHFWRDHPHILAGRDQLKGGAWFGVNARGRIAGVTNFRGARESDAAAIRDARSRGQLVARFLEGADSLAAFEKFLHREHHHYNPFHLIYGDRESLHCFSSSDARARRLQNGFHSIGNGALDDTWPKMSRGVESLRRNIFHNDLAAAALAKIMQDPAQAEDASPPEKFLSSIFIRGETFGTRATTLLFGGADAFELYEYNYAPGGEMCGREYFSLAPGRARI